MAQPPATGQPPDRPRFPEIARRDFLLGLGGAGGLLAATGAQAQDPAPEAPPADHPSRRTGLQGQTDAVNRAAHAGRDQPGSADPDQPAERDEAVEDLVVVGAGLSGLAGAWLFRQHAGRPVRILLLDALDDVGGHARRNEFVSRSGRRLVGYGGSQSLDGPSGFSPAMHGLLRELGIDLARFSTEFFDRDWSGRHGLVNRAVYFSAREWGREQVVLRAPEAAPGDWLPHTPLPPAAQADLARLLGEPAPDSLPAPLRALARLGSAAARRARLADLPYDQFLRQMWQVHPATLRYLNDQTQGYFGAGTDATSALDAWAGGLPGFAPLALGSEPDRRNSPSGRHLLRSSDDYIYHFPDGNAGLARALIRSLIPAALPGGSGGPGRMESLADGVMDMAALDRPDSPVRLRLQATALHLRHLGPPGQAEQVELSYRDGQGRLRRVRSRQVLLACWHRVIARLSDELPAAQRAALDDQVKVPLLYANVLLSHWQPFARAGVHGIHPVAGFWSEAGLDFAVRMGTLGPPASPDEPVLLHLAKVVLPGDGRPPREQAAAGRAQLLGWSFEHLEGEIRQLLQGAMGPWGFRHETDIEAITVNRWAHGYAYEYMRPWDRALWPRRAGHPLPCEVARHGWGRVAIANSDAGAFAYAHGAVDQAVRAVQTLLPQARLPDWRSIDNVVP